MNNCSPWIHEIYQEIFEICTDLGILVVNAKYAQKYTVAYTRFFAQCLELNPIFSTHACFKAMDMSGHAKTFVIGINNFRD